MLRIAKEGYVLENLAAMFYPTRLAFSRKLVKTVLSFDRKSSLNHVMEQISELKIEARFGPYFF